MIQPTATLIATLGSEAQVITLALDCLLDLGHNVDRVIVIHTAPEAGPVKEALTRVRAEFSGKYYSVPMKLETVQLQVNDSPLADVDTLDGARATFVALYRVVRAEKLAERGVHLSIAGGRETMSVFGMAVAQMLFDVDDRLWHLVSYGRLLEDKRMHAGPGESVDLIQIPVLLWSAISPMLTDLSRIDDPFEAAEYQRSLRFKETIAEAKTFIEDKLTKRQRPVVELLVREGLGNGEIAERLVLSPRTIESHLNASTSKAEKHWQLAEVTRTQLISLLSPKNALEGIETNATGLHSVPSVFRSRCSNASGIRLGQTHLNRGNARCEKMRAIRHWGEQDSHDRHTSCQYPRAFWNHRRPAR